MVSSPTYVIGYDPANGPAVSSTVICWVCACGVVFENTEAYFEHSMRCLVVARLWRNW